MPLSRARDIDRGAERHYGLTNEIGPVGRPTRVKGGDIVGTILRVCAAFATFYIATAGNVRAEVSEITIAQQYGVSFLPLMVMEREGLIDKHAKQVGLSDLKVKWVKVAGPAIMNDGLIS